jgi:hypothetical protein
VNVEGSVHVIWLNRQTENDPDGSSPDSAKARWPLLQELASPSQNRITNPPFSTTHASCKIPDPSTQKSRHETAKIRLLIPAKSKNPVAF